MTWPIPHWQPRADAMASRWVRAVERVLQRQPETLFVTYYHDPSLEPVEVAIPSDRQVRFIEVVDAFERDQDGSEAKREAGNEIVWERVRRGRIRVVDISGISAVKTFDVTLRVTLE